MKYFKLSILFFIFTSAIAMANISVPAIFGNHMVLQQNAEISLWGWGKPMEKITITSSWNNDTLKTEVSNQANWSVILKTPKAGGPHSIHIQGYNHLEISDILIGEVWLLSGQSNMEWSPRLGIENAEEVVSQSTQNDIRFFSVTHRTALNPNYDVDGEWVICQPESVIDFSALGYFFGKKLHQVLNVPVGLINASWGGTPIEVWIPEEKIVTNEMFNEASKLISEMPWAPREPGGVYNAMIAPIMPFNIAGTLWYQGETNTRNPETYTKMMETLIQAWRDGFKSDFPFYFAQIAPFKHYPPQAGVEIREAQRLALTIPKTGMVVLSDIGDTTNIHPKRKQEAGDRFADLALNKTYGLSMYPPSGPLFEDYQIEGKKVIVKFKFANGLHCKGKKLTHFELAGENGLWYPAKAIIKKDQVVVSTSKVSKPVNVRFGWHNTATPNLFNASNLPASCFNSLSTCNK